MATTIQTIINTARVHLIEAAASFWADADLVLIANRGARDLWRAINDNFQDYFFTVDATTVSADAGASTLTGVPADCTIVRGIEPRSLSTYPNLKFRPKSYDHADFQAARALSAQDPAQGGIVWYAITKAGAPIAAPEIHFAPELSASVPLRLIYVPSLSEFAIEGNNPIPGESDNALVAWVVAYALAREREDRSPSPDWLAVYASEKANILTSLTPRQTDEDQVAEAVFEPYW